MSMREAKRHLQSEMMFLAYDSLCGLPASNSSHNFGSRWAEGLLSTSIDEFEALIKSSGFSLERVRTLKGFHKDNPHSIDVSAEFSSKAALINIDCNFHESALPVFPILSNSCKMEQFYI